MLDFLFVHVLVYVHERGRERERERESACLRVRFSWIQGLGIQVPGLLWGWSGSWFHGPDGSSTEVLEGTLPGTPKICHIMRSGGLLVYVYTHIHTYTCIYVYVYTDVSLHEHMGMCLSRFF